MADFSFVKYFKDAGTWVTVLQRKNDDRAEIEKMGAFLCKGDALVDKDVKRRTTWWKNTTPW